MPFQPKLPAVRFDPNEIAVLYYFGDLSYLDLPKVAADALELGFDGPSLRRLAGLISPVASDMRAEEIDSAFREMGVAAPMGKDKARLTLAAKSARKAVRGDSNVFNEATHIRIHVCGLEEPPPELRKIVTLSEESEHAPRWKWKRLEQELKEAMTEFIRNRESLL